MSGLSTRGGGNEADEERIHLSIKAPDGRVVYFKTRRSIKLQKLLTTFCKRLNLEYSVVDFLYDGNRFPKKKTPNDLLMEDRDQIEACMHVGGGGMEL